jgi:hypothetical protein
MSFDGGVLSSNFWLIIFMPKPVFKAYQQKQAWLIPPSLDDLIDVNHPVRVVSEVIDSIDIVDPKVQGRGSQQLSSPDAT